MSTTCLVLDESSSLEDSPPFKCQIIGTNPEKLKQSLKNSFQALLLSGDKLEGIDLNARLFNKGMIFFPEVYAELPYSDNIHLNTALNLSNQVDVKDFLSILDEKPVQTLQKKRNEAESIKNWSRAKIMIDYFRFSLSTNLINLSISEMIEFLNEWYLILWYGTPQSERVTNCRILAQSILKWLSEDLARFNHLMVLPGTLVSNLTTVSIVLSRDIQLKVKESKNLAIIYLSDQKLPQDQALSFLSKRRWTLKVLDTIESLPDDTFIVLLYNHFLDGLSFPILKDKVNLIVNPDNIPFHRSNLNKLEIMSKITEHLIKMLNSLNFEYLIRIKAGRLSPPLEEESFLSETSSNEDIFHQSHKNSDLICHKNRLEGLPLTSETYFKFASLGQDPLCREPKIDWPTEKKDEYTVFVGSHRPQKVTEMRKVLPYLVHLDGTGYPSFSKLVNDCIKNCPTEIFIFMADKIAASQEDVDKIVNKIKEGYAFVGLYSFGFFGFKKELVRRIGFMDERYLGGGYEDNDYLSRIMEDRLPFYHTGEATYKREVSTWLASYDLGRKFFHEKWLEKDGKVIRRLPDEYFFNKSSSNIVWYDKDLRSIYNYIWPKMPKVHGGCLIGGYYRKDLDKYLIDDCFNKNTFWEQDLEVIQRLIKVKYVLHLGPISDVCENFKKCQITRIVDHPVKNNFSNEDLTWSDLEVLIYQMKPSFDLLVVNCNNPHTETISIIEKCLPLGEYILLYEKFSETDQYTPHFYQGQSRLVLDKFRSEGFETMTFSGLSLIHKRNISH